MTERKPLRERGKKLFERQKIAEIDKTSLRYVKEAKPFERKKTGEINKTPPLVSQPPPPPPPPLKPPPRLPTLQVCDGTLRHVREGVEA